MHLEKDSNLEILVLGGGVAGLTTAMALAKFTPPGAKWNITVFEIRPEPGVIGGAVNLTPNALRLMDRLGVYEIMLEKNYGCPIDAIEVFNVYGKKQMGESSFAGPDGKGLGNPPYKVRVLVIAHDGMQ